MTELEQLKKFLKEKNPNRSVNYNKDLQEFSANDMIEFAKWKEKNNRNQKDNSDVINVHADLVNSLIDQVGRGNTAVTRGAVKIRLLKAFVRVIAAREKTSIDDLVSFGFYITNGNYKNLCNSVTCTVSDFIIR